VKVSVNLGSSRPGGVDISFYGLARQTYQDFEVIFVDGRYHKRHAAVLRAWENACADTGCKAPLFHVPNHRSNGTGIWPETCAGFNTGFMLSDGELVVMMMDHAYAPQGWLAQHVCRHEESKRGRLVVGPQHYRGPLPSRTLAGREPEVLEQGMFGEAKLREQYGAFDEVSILAEPFDPAQFRELGSKVENGFDREGPKDPICMRTKNESFPLVAALAVNGVDETFDLGAGPGDYDFARRLALSGLEVWGMLDEGKLVCSNPRGILPNGSNLGKEHERAPAPWDYRPCWAEGLAYFNRQAAARTVRAPNCYDLVSRKYEIRHWRELSQRREAVIPRNVIPDKEYFHVRA
jgi:hypothetical protein